jgi:hypothetical protein
VPGNQNLILTLYWKFLTPLPPDAFLKINLGDRSTNTSVVEKDTFLLNEYAPPEKIKPNPMLWDVHQLKIPLTTSTKRYQINIAWFSRKQAKFLGQAVISEVEF